MLGLIAFALLILACSYWKLSGYLAAGGDGGAPAPEAAAGEKIPAMTAAAAVKYEEKVVVIMAGDAKPTFLATPVSSRASSFGDNSGDSKLKEKNEKKRRRRKKKIKMHERIPKILLRIMERFG
uniref:Uncharacterized protein n=1 Tax=Ananas comosus var. bracteatus TaxID=296719 RepID=A0A6V7P3Y6_ANACO|nr:unnamed protein product [Ananas comosus var. bracteatus]